VVECEEGLARIEVMTKKAGRTRFLCRALLGMYSLIPSLRSANSAVVETRCINRGDPLCEFSVRWRDAGVASPGADPWTERVQRLQQWAVRMADENIDHAPEALEAAVLLDEIRRKALCDPLTGVANRAALELRAEDEFDKRGGDLDGLTLLFVDLDGFKGINDELGHAAGDELLIQLAARLEGVVRESDFVARLGGDEFIVLFPRLSDDETVERMVGKVLRVFQDPFLVAGQLHELSGSVGVSRAPDHGSTFNQLLDHADDAMYRVKRARKTATPSRVD
jgi:diguanylate cyclase (GGDEF)-like protein